MINDLTLIVTARERRSTLPRVVEYYKNFPCRIMLLDGSSERWDKIDTYKHIEYFHLPRMPWMQKMVYGLERVKTPYTLKLCDDDIVFLHAIPIMLDFLKNNPDYQTVMGQEISLLDRHFEYETYEYLLEVNQQDHFDDPTERMEFYWTHFNCKIHSMTKTKTQLEVYQFMLDNPDIYAVRFFDKVWTLIVASRGKFKVLPILSHMRSRESKVAPPYAPGLHPSLQAETKSNLRFESDFIDRDLIKLQEFVGGLDTKLMRQMHENLCNENKKHKAFSKLLQELPLKTPPLTLNYGEQENSVWGVAQERSRADIDQNSGSPDNPSDVYPVYKKESVKAVSEMFSVFEKYPL